MLYYITKYKIIRSNVILFVFMFFVYYLFYIFSPELYEIDNSSNMTNYGIVNIFYFNTMIHREVAIGDITPRNWVLKLIVSWHILLVPVVTGISLFEDIINVMDDRDIKIEEQSRQSLHSESIPLLYD